MIATIITTIASTITGIFTNYSKTKQAKNELELAKLQEQRLIVSQTIRADLERGTTQIKSTGKWFKYFTFIMWFGPFMATMFNAEYGVNVFNNLKQLPDWYAQSVMVIMFAVWGISASRETLGSIFTNVGNYFTAKTKFNMKRKIFFDTLRSVKGNISEQEVVLFDKVMDKLEDE